MMRDLLLVIDMQNVYTEGQKWACIDTKDVAERIRQIITSDKCQEVIFTVYVPAEQPKGVWREYNRVNADINGDMWAGRLMPQFEEYKEKYPIYQKNVYSSISIPQVLEAAHQADRVVVTGVVAECCVLSTIFRLVDEGIKTVYLTDAVSGSEREKLKATELILLGLSPLHVEVMSVEEYLKEDM